mgnify:CR=1 FL=1
MRSSLAPGFGLLLALLPACAAPEFDCADPEGSGWTDDRIGPEDQMLDEVNARRAAGATCNGVALPAVPDLTSNALLRCAARRHAVDLGSRDYFDHVSPEGTAPADRVDDAGYDWSRVAENLAAGMSSASVAVEGLIQSTTGHCENIMDADVTEAGMGSALIEGSTYTTYWVQVFAAPQ